MICDQILVKYVIIRDKEKPTSEPQKLLKKYIDPWTNIAVLVLSQWNQTQANPLKDLMQFESVRKKDT